MNKLQRKSTFSIVNIDIKWGSAPKLPSNQHQEASVSSDERVNYSSVIEQGSVMVNDTQQRHHNQHKRREKKKIHEEAVPPIIVINEYKKQYRSK